MYTTPITMDACRTLAAELLSLRSERAGEFDPRLISGEILTVCWALVGLTDAPLPRTAQISRTWYAISCSLSNVRHQISTGIYA